MSRFGHILAGMAIAAAILLGFLAGRRWPQEAPGGTIPARVDTLVIRDTVLVTEAQTVTKTVIRKVPYAVTDTVRMRDTLYVYLEREQVRWQDSLSVVYASGIDPTVDSVTHFIRDRIITREIPVQQVRKTRWNIGIQAGMGTGGDGLSPYVGVGVSYGLVSW